MNNNVHQEEKGKGGNNHNYSQDLSNLFESHRHTTVQRVNNRKSGSPSFQKRIPKAYQHGRWHGTTLRTRG